MWIPVVWALLLGDPASAEEMHRRAAAFYESGNFPEAARSETRALDLWSREPGVTPLHLLPSHANLAEIYLGEGRLTEAEKEAHLVLDLIATSSRPFPGEQANALSVLAKVALLTGRYEQAEQTQHQVVAIWEVAPVQPARLAVALGDLGMIRAARGELTAARALLDQALALHRTKSGAGSVHPGRILINLGLVCIKQADFRAADGYYQEGTAVLIARLGPDHPEVGLALAERAFVLRKTGRKEEARRLEAQANRIRQASPDSLRSAIVDVESLKR